jgi:hypothetical protein
MDAMEDMAATLLRVSALVKEEASVAEEDPAWTEFLAQHPELTDETGGPPHAGMTDSPSVFITIRGGSSSSMKYFMTASVAFPSVSMSPALCAAST